MTLIKLISQIIRKIFTKWVCQHRYYFRENVGVLCDLCGNFGPRQNVGCAHKFERIEAYNITAKRGAKEVQTGMLYTLKCKGCGIIEGKKVSI